jgi:hypothetical protein
VPIPPELSRRLEERIRAFIASQAWEPSVRTLAARLGALPLYADMHSCIALHPSGQLLEVGSDQDWSGEVSALPTRLDAGWRQRVLRAASVKYPELADVLEAVLGG